MFKRIISLLIVLIFGFESTGFAQVAGQLDISARVSAGLSNIIQDKFRPIHLRYLEFNPTQENFKLLLDKGSVKNPNQQLVDETTKELLKYFLVGVSLPNDAFWVNLRPDASNEIIDENLAKTDVGKILLEADLQLKKDTAKYTSPQTLEGKEYWNKLYQKAEELYGNSQTTIPTLNRPWIVPDEIIVRENQGSAYIYKATLKVMLEGDYLKGSQTYNFTDEKAKALNEYSSQLLKETIIPKITKEINSAKRYASLRQVYYSLILAQWFKRKYNNAVIPAKVGIQNSSMSSKIDSKDLTNLTSKESWSKETYFQAYQKSFKEGEYNVKEPRYTSNGQVIRTYVSGGIVFTNELPRLIEAGLIKSNLGYAPSYFKTCLRTEAFYTETGDLQITQATSQGVELIRQELNVASENIKKEEDGGTKKDLRKFQEAVNNGEIKTEEEIVGLATRYSVSSKDFQSEIRHLEKLSVVNFNNKLTGRMFFFSSVLSPVVLLLSIKIIVQHILANDFNIVNSLWELFGVVYGGAGSYVLYKNLKPSTTVNDDFPDLVVMKNAYKQLYEDGGVSIEDIKDKGYRKIAEKLNQTEGVISLTGVQMNILARKYYLPSTSEVEKIFAEKLYYRLTYQQRKELARAFIKSARTETRRAMLNAGVKNDVELTDLQTIIFYKKLNELTAMSLENLKTKLEKFYSRIGIKLDKYTGMKDISVGLLYNYVKGLQAKEKLPVIAKENKNSNFFSRVTAFIAALFVATIVSKVIDDKERKDLQTNHDQALSEFFGDSFDLGMTAAADMIIQSANEYSGPGWASAAMNIELIDVSSKDYLDVLVNANADGKVKIQMLDPDIKDDDGFFGLANTVFSVQKGEQVIRVNLHQFDGVDLTKVRRIVVHYGEKTWGDKLNSPGFIAQFKGYEFVTAPVVVKEESFFDSIGNFFSNLFSFKLTMFAASADMTMMSAIPYSGNNWESAVMNTVEQDVSGAKYMNVLVSSKGGGFIDIQLLDETSRDGQSSGVIGPFKIEDGDNVIQIDLNRYKDLGVDLTKVRRIVVHSGQEAWGAKLNDKNIWASFKGYEFTSIQQEAQTNPSFIDGIIKTILGFVNMKVTMFAASADTMMQPAQVWSGDKWASAVMSVSGDISSQEYLDVEVAANQDGNVKIQLLDKNIEDGDLAGVIGPFSVKAGQQKIRIAVKDFSDKGVDLTTPRQLVVHYGEEAWNVKLNKPGFIATFKNYEFTSSNSQNIPVAVPTSVVAAAGIASTATNKKDEKSVSSVKSTQAAKVWTGDKWASAIIPVSGDISNQEFVDVQIDAAKAGKVKVQLLDKNIQDGQNTGVLGPFDVKSGAQTIRIATKDFANMGVDLATARQIVVHYGQEVWGAKINEQGFFMTFKGYEFTSGNAQNIPTSVPTAIVTTNPTQPVVRKTENTVVQTQSPVQSQPAAPLTEVAARPQVKAVVSWMDSTIEPKTGLTKSFKPSAGYLAKITDIHEKRVLEDGLVTYDGALQQILYMLTGNKDMADKYTYVYLKDKLNSYQTILARYQAGNREKPFVYDPSNPELLNQQDLGGYFFKIIDSSGQWMKDGVEWSQWQPVSGENAWAGGIGPLQVYYQKYGNTYVKDAPELQLADRSAKIAMILQADNGGIRMSPIGTWSANEDPNEKNPSNFKWMFNEISTENCISWYATFQMLYQITGKEEYKKAMEKLENYFRSAYNAQTGVMAQGMHYNEDTHQWVANSVFATDCQTWLTSGLGVEKVDAMFGEGASYKLWQSARGQAGVFDANGNLLGLDFTNYKVLGRSAMVSVEWTKGAKPALKKMIKLYANSHPEWIAQMQKDIQTSDAYMETLKTADGAYFYSSARGETGHGWTAAGPIDGVEGFGSAASTVWAILVDQFDFNPFILGGGRETSEGLPVGAIAAGAAVGLGVLGGALYLKGLSKRKKNSNSIEETVLEELNVQEQQIVENLKTLLEQKGTTKIFFNDVYKIVNGKNFNIENVSSEVEQIENSKVKIVVMYLRINFFLQKLQGVNIYQLNENIVAQLLEESGISEKKYVAQDKKAMVNFIKKFMIGQIEKNGSFGKLSEKTLPLLPKTDGGTIIVVNSQHAAGKSTLTKLLAQRTGFEVFQGGALMRSIADGQVPDLNVVKMDLPKYTNYLNTYTDERTMVDDYIDAIQEQVMANGDMIFDSSLSSYIVEKINDELVKRGHKVVRVLLTADLLERGRRAYNRGLAEQGTNENYNSIEQAIANIKARDLSDQNKFLLKTNGYFDIYNYANYDLIFDTTYTELKDYNQFADQTLEFIDNVDHFGVGVQEDGGKKDLNGMGGIDFRTLPITTQQAVSVLFIGNNGLAMNKLEAIDLDQKIAELQKMVNSDITPSAAKIKEYVQAASLKTDAKEYLDKILACVVEMMKMQEEKYCVTNKTVKDIVLVLESGISVKQLKQVVTGIS